MADSELPYSLRKCHKELTSHVLAKSTQGFRRNGTDIQLDEVSTLPKANYMTFLASPPAPELDSLLKVGQSVLFNPGFRGNESREL